MSRQSFEAFMRTLQKDGSLQQELRDTLGDPAQGVSAEGLNHFAAGKGYDFKVEEITGELNEKQLDSVAGGVLSFSRPATVFKVEPTTFPKIGSSPLGTQYIKLVL